MLTLNDLSIRIGSRLLIENTSVQLPERGRVGLVGRNGTGKSTLLKAILGEVAIEAGAIKHRNNARIGTVSQETPSGDQTPLDHVLAANTERTALLAELETTENGNRVAAIHERLNDIDANAAPARVARILAGLGFDEETQNRKLDTFSGGWRMRVALAAGLFSEPDFLLLDEPTNHLDLEATIWLEGYLARYPNGLLLVSHDKDLLNRVADGILHLESRSLTYYAGNFERFERSRREKNAQQQATFERQQAERKHIQAFVDRFRYKASKARQAQSRLKMLERMEPIAAVTGDRQAKFVFPQPTELAPPIFELKSASVGYEKNNPILRNLNVRLDMDDRIALIGANGNGKSTMIKIITGVYKQDYGDLIIGSNKQSFSSPNEANKSGISVVHQERNLIRRFSVGENLMLNNLPKNNLGLINYDEVAKQSKKWLDIMELDIHPNTIVSELTVAKMQLCEIAKALSLESKILLLDEPTSSLSPQDTKNLFALLKRLVKEQDVSIVFVSHKLEEVFEICDEVTVLRDGKNACVSENINNLDRQKLVKLMIGRDEQIIKSKENKNCLDRRWK